MEQHFRRSMRSSKAMLMISATDHGCHSCSPTGWSERRISRWVGIGVLAMTLGALGLGLVDTSPTRPASTVRTSVIPATPRPAPRSSAPRPAGARRRTMQKVHTQSPLPLLESRERMASRPSDDVRGRETTLSFTPQGFSLTVTGSRLRPGIIRQTTWNQESIAMGGVTVPSRWTVTLDFVGANPEVRPKSLEVMPAAGRPSIDPQPQETIDRPISTTLHYRNVWPGIDLLYTVAAGRLQSTFVVTPGADPNHIQFAYHGITALRRTEAGRLEISTPAGSFTEDVPVAYQESLHLARLARLRDGGASVETYGVNQEQDGQRVAVAVTYTLQPSGDTSVWGLHVKAYDPNIPLTINRVTHYSGFTDGSAPDSGPDILAAEGIR